jgi:hypothetical protein
MENIQKFYMSILLKLDYRLNASPVNNPTEYFGGTWTR